MMRYAIGMTLLSFVLVSGIHAEQVTEPPAGATVDDGTWYVLSEDRLPDGAHHTEHLARYGRDITGYNRYVLGGIDTAQASAMDGGGYFIGIKADPPESPIGYELTLIERPMLAPPRETSYCSGATYTAFIEALNLWYLPSGPEAKQTSIMALDEVRAEAMRMQEPDGGRREDGVKFWGHWNDDGYGSQFALVQYSGMGEEVAPNRARPGDFMNISWTNGGGHSVVFLGWHKDDEGGKHLLYWSSQKGTNGMGDQLVSLERIRKVKIVRLINPGRLFTFDPTQEVKDKVPGDSIDW